MEYNNWWKLEQKLLKYIVFLRLEMENNAVASKSLKQKSNAQEKQRVRSEKLTKMSSITMC